MTTSKKLTYTMSEELFGKLNVDENKTHVYSKDQRLIKIGIQCGSLDSFRDFDRHIKKLLEYIDGTGDDPATFAPKN